jgi:hypothetical protein
MANRLRSWRHVTDRWRFNLLEDLRPIVELLLLLGLVLILTARGCDSVGDRYVDSARAKADYEEAKWNAYWDNRLDRIAVEEEAIRAKETQSSADGERLDDLRSRRRRLEDEREIDRRERVHEWNILRRDAQETATQHRMAGVWYQVVFLLGTILFSIGLLVVGVTGDGPSRWIALGLLAIILFSVYVTGAPWANVPPDLPSAMRSGSQ